MGNPVGVKVVDSTSPMQKRTASINPKAKMPLMPTDSTMARGTFLGASVTSAAKCITPSKPSMILAAKLLLQWVKFHLTDKHGRDG